MAPKHKNAICPSILRTGRSVAMVALLLFGGQKASRELWKDATADCRNFLGARPLRIIPLNMAQQQAGRVCGRKIGRGCVVFPNRTRILARMSAGRDQAPGFTPP